MLSTPDHKEYVEPVFDAGARTADQVSERVGEDAQAVHGPWFVTYNRIYSAPYHTKLHALSPFPHSEFCGYGPWEDHRVISHFGVEPFAKDAGFDRVEEYLKSRIASAPKSGSFCTDCPSCTCPEKNRNAT